MAGSDATHAASPEGERGELIGRLVALLDDAPDVDPHWWANLGLIVAFCIGGIRRLPSIPDEPFKPGTVGAIQAERYGMATRGKFVELIRERLSDLVGQELSEAFLVRGSRDELLRWVARLSEIEGVNELRAEMRQDMRDRAGSPRAISEFRDHLAEYDPEAAQLSDDDVRQRLLDMAAKSHLDPLAAEDVVDSWAQKERLERRCEELLSDRFIDDWTMRRAIRGMDEE